jgi:hypothetical protein
MGSNVSEENTISIFNAGDGRPYVKFRVRNEAPNLNDRGCAAWSRLSDTSGGGDRQMWGNDGMVINRGKPKTLRRKPAYGRTHSFACKDVNPQRTQSC